MKKIFYVFLILNLTMSAAVFASEHSKDSLLSRINGLYRFLEEKVHNGCNFDSSLEDQITTYIASTVGVDNFNEQYKLIRAAMKNVDVLKKSREFIKEHSEEMSELLDKVSKDLKMKHPEIKAEKTVMFSQVSTFISKTEVDDAISNAGGGSVFASSMIEEDATKSKKNKSSYEQLMAQNNLLSMLVENFKKEKNELMDKQVELSAENGGLREKISSLERQLESLDKVNSLNDLYKQITGIYQKIVKTKADFDTIIKLKKQIKGLENENK